MMIFKYPVVDRSREDVEYAKGLKAKGWKNFTEEEKEKWKNGLKGALNLDDVKRVLNNLEYVNQYKRYQLIVPSQDDYIVNDNIFEDLYWLLFFVYNDAPLLPYNDHEKWNEIEQLLQSTMEEIKKNSIETNETAYRLAFRVGSDKGVIKI